MSDAAEQLAAAEADLADLRRSAEDVRLRLAAKEKEIAALEAERKALQTQYQAYGFGWTRFGSIQVAERRVEDAKRALADETAPKVIVNLGRHEEQWVLLAATPAQVKARRVGEPHATLFTVKHDRWTCYAGHLVNYDHEAAMAWYAAQKKVNP